jgi:hypothetical protein
MSVDFPPTFPTAKAMGWAVLFPPTVKTVGWGLEGDLVREAVFESFIVGDYE